MCVLTQSCLTLCKPMDYSLSGSSVHGIFQARIRKCVAISYSRAGLPDPGIEPESLVSPALWTNSLPTEPLITPKFPDSIDHRMLISALTSLKRTKVREC